MYVCICIYIYIFINIKIGLTYPSSKGKKNTERQVAPALLHRWWHHSRPLGGAYGGLGIPHVRKPPYDAYPFKYIIYIVINQSIYLSIYIKYVCIILSSFNQIWVCNSVPKSFLNPEDFILVKTAARQAAPPGMGFPQLGFAATEFRKGHALVNQCWRCHPKLPIFGWEWWSPRSFRRSSCLALNSISTCSIYLSIYLPTYLSIYPSIYLNYESI